MWCIAFARDMFQMLKDADNYLFEVFTLMMYDVAYVPNYNFVQTLNIQYMTCNILDAVTTIPLELPLFSLI